MIQTSQLYKSLFEQGAIQEYKVEIDGTTYTNESIYSISLSENLFDKDVFTLGSFCSSQIKIKFKIRTGNIPRNAIIKFFYRYVQDGMYSEWVQRFVGKVTGRTAGTNTTTVEAKDVAANTDVFLDVFQTQIPSYPANARNVATLIAQHLGLTVENIDTVWNGNVVEYPNELSVIQVLKYIGILSGGNWMITGSGKLRLCVPIPSYNISGIYSARQIESLSNAERISRVTVYWDDERAFTAGTDVGMTLELDCPWATQGTTNNVFINLSTFYYRGHKTHGALIDPAIELGDYFLLENEGGNERQLGQDSQWLGIGNHLGGKGQSNDPNRAQLCARMDWTFDGSCSADVESPNNNEYIYDDPYNELMDKKFARKLTLGDSYHGITIGRNDGIQMVWSPDGTLEHATGRFYADLTAGMGFQYRSDYTKEWLDWLYYDINEKIFKLAFYNTKDEITSLLEITEDRIHTFVGDNYSSIDITEAAIEQALDSAYSYTNQTKAGIIQEVGATYQTKTDASTSERLLTESVSRVEQTASQISQTVASNYQTLVQSDNANASAITSAESRLTQRADEISSSVISNYKTLNTRLTADEVRITSAESNITQTASSISSEIIARQNGDAVASSHISQLANNITLSVSNNVQGTGASIVLSAYNPETGSTNTARGNVNITGFVTFSSLSGSGTSVINGDNITTGIISSRHMKFNSAIWVLGEGAPLDAVSPNGYIGSFSGNNGTSNTYGVQVAGLRDYYMAATSGGVGIFQGNKYSAPTAGAWVSGNTIYLRGAVRVAPAGSNAWEDLTNVGGGTPVPAVWG